MKDIVRNLCSFNRFFKSKEIYKAQRFIISEFKKLNLKIKLQPIHTEYGSFYNIRASKNFETDNKIIISAHYDTFKNYPGADDNASGIAGVIECARKLNISNYPLEFVAFCLEEPPFYGTDKMGSFVYAKNLKEENQKIAGAVVFEMIGYYSDYQKIPDELADVIPSNKGDFIVNVANEKSANFLEKLNLKANNLKSYNLVTDNQLARLSDNRSFWDFDYEAIMITDTAFLRNPNYHTLKDTIETLDFEKMEKVVDMVVNGIENYFKGANNVFIKSKI